MKKLSVIFTVLTLTLLSCETKKTYADYKASDFYEVQGFILSAVPTAYPFDHSTKKNISFNYFLDRKTPAYGTENNLEMFEAKAGLPLIVLVHKSDETISFYGRVGLLKTLNTKEKEFLSQQLKNLEELTNQK